MMTEKVNYYISIDQEMYIAFFQVAKVVQQTTYAIVFCYKHSNKLARKNQKPDNM